MKLSTKALLFSIILSFVLFALPYLLPLPNDNLPTYRNIPQEEGYLLKVDNYETFILEKNPAARETIVLIHGFAGSHKNFHNTIEVLKNKGYHVIAIDLINFGYSERDTSKPMTHQDQANLIYEVLKKLNISKASFIGHSMGASVIYHFYSAHPEMVSRMIFISPAINIQNKYFTISEFILRIPGVERWFRIIFQLIINEGTSEKLLEKVLINNEINVDDIQNYYTDFMKVKDWDLGIINSSYDFEKNNIEINLNVETPIYVIWGREDEFVKKEDLNSIIAFENVELLVMENSGHLPFEDASKEFNNNLLYCIGNQIQ